MWASLMSESDSTASSWYEASRVACPDRPRLTVDLDVDVCVIGAGLAGLTIAREIAQRGWSVAVLEAGHVAQNVVLAATVLGLTVLPLGGFYDRRLDALVGADGLAEASLYALVLGGSA